MCELLPAIVEQLTGNCPNLAQCMVQFVVVMLGRNRFLTKVLRHVSDLTQNKEITIHNREYAVEADRRLPRFSYTGSAGMGRRKGGGVIHSGVRCNHWLRIELVFTPHARVAPTVDR